MRMLNSVVRTGFEPAYILAFFLNDVTHQSTVTANGFKPFSYCSIGFYLV